jgi:hypothetical protein
MMESRMRDIVFFLVFGAFVWAATVVVFVSLYIYAGDRILCELLDDQGSCARLEWQNALLESRWLTNGRFSARSHSMSSTHNIW